MFYGLSALALALSQLVYAQDNDTATVRAALENARVIPDVIGNFTPVFPLEVVFTADGSTYAVTAGANLTKAQIAKIPTFAIVSNDTAIVGKPYLIAIVDPDAATPQDRNESEFRNFLGADYISDNNTNGVFVLTNRSKTETLTDYSPPKPADGSGPHRIVVLCYLQNTTGVTPPSGFNATKRTNFNITEFVGSVQGNNMTLLGATFFYVNPNDTTGSVTPHTTNPITTAPASTPSTVRKDSDGMRLDVVVAWTLVMALSATGALLI